LTSTNDSKHVRAHGGIKLVMVVARVRPAAVVEVVYDEAAVVGVDVGEARTRTAVWKVAHDNNSSLWALEDAILEGTNDIYLFVANDMAGSQFSDP